MKRFNAIYNNGEVELIDKPDSTEPTKVFVLFPDENTEIRALRGAKKSKSPIDYSAISKDLAELSKESEKHIEEENNS